jgi:hypothetical protein
VAEALKKEPGVQVQSVEGNRGEFTVTVGGQVVAQKTDSLPSVEEVVDAVRDAEPHPVGV